MNMDFRPAGAVIWENRRRRWWHKVIWWRRPRAVVLEPPGPGEPAGGTITWDEHGQFWLDLGDGQ
jgi:hypothetical protein